MFYLLQLLKISQCGVESNYFRRQLSSFIYSFNQYVLDHNYRQQGYGNEKHTRLSSQLVYILVRRQEKKIKHLLCCILIKTKKKNKAERERG